MVRRHSVTHGLPVCGGSGELVDARKEHELDPPVHRPVFGGVVRDQRFEGSLTGRDESLRPQAALDEPPYDLDGAQRRELPARRGLLRARRGVVGVGDDLEPSIGNLAQRLGEGREDEIRLCREFELALVEQQVAGDDHHRVTAPHRHRDLVSLDLLLQPMCEFLELSDPLLGSFLGLAELLEPRLRVLQSGRERPLLGEDRVHVLAEAGELRAEVLVDRGGLVELGLEVVRRGLELDDLGIALRSQLGGRRQPGLELLDLLCVVLRSGVGRSGHVIVSRLGHAPREPTQQTCHHEGARVGEHDTRALHVPHHPAHLLLGRTQ